MKIVVATDSFRGSLTAIQACKTIAESIRSVVPKADIIIKPMADGGEGTAQVMIAANNGQWIKKTVTGPLPDMRVEAGFAWFRKDETALVEMAEASGLELLKPSQRNPMKTTTYGTGQLIAAAINHGAKHLLLAIGGSATVDCGTGAAAALGWKFLDKKGQEIVPCGGELLRISKIVPPTPPISVSMEVLCDVTNTLYGENGAAKMYAPQKGATREMVEQLEKGLQHIAKLIKKQLGPDIKDIPGTGAAGGLSAGAIAFMGARLVSGIQTVMTYSRLREAADNADWLITGEGKFDRQSLWGKVVAGVVQVARDAGTKAAVLAGQVLLEPSEYRKFGVADAIGCMTGQMTLEYAMKNSEKLLAKAAKSFAIKHLSS